MAIAHDASSVTTSNSASSLTVSHTCTGSNLCLIVTVCDNGNLTTGVTYNGVSMTLSDSYTTSSPYIRQYYLLNPATGTHDIVVSASGAQAMRVNGDSYTGVKQSGQPDAVSNGSGSIGGVGNFSSSVTTVADGSWVIVEHIQVSTDNSGVTFTSGNTRSNGAAWSGIYHCYGDSGEVTSAGSKTMSSGTWSANTFHYCMTSISPVPLITFSVSESLALSETVTNLRARLFSLAETLSLSETVSAFKGVAFSVADTLGLVEAFTSSRTFVFTVAESLGIVEVLAQVKLKWKKQTKNNSSFTKQSKNNSSWNNQIEN